MIAYLYMQHLQGISRNQLQVASLEDTISQDNPKAIQQLFKLFVSFLKDADLIAGETLAIEGTKSRAHNGKKSNFNPKKIDKHKEYIEAKTHTMPRKWYG
jgi:hypothetical protein